MTSSISTPRVKYWLCPLYSFSCDSGTVDLEEGIQIKRIPREFTDYLSQRSNYSLRSPPSDVEWMASFIQKTENSDSDVSKYFADLYRWKKPVDYISIQALGGTGTALREGEKIVLKRLQDVNSAVREDVSIKHLVVGTECGASDSFSGITANPLIGKTVDKIIHAGGSAILSETPEMIGAEKVLISRMISKKVARKFTEGMNYYRSLADRLNISMDGNFVAGNEDAGLVNLTLKSLGAVLKGGTTKIVDFIDYAERIKRQGLSIMNGPGNDLESMTGIAASGANIILFSTGMGTTEGNLIVPVIKIPTRTEVYKKMKEDMDFNAGSLLSGNISLDELSGRLLSMVIAVASGKKTWSEVWRKRSFQIWTAGKLSL